MKTTVAIVGVGLIGGSLGRALRRTGRYHVIGLGRNAARLRLAKRLGAVDAASTRWSDVRSADLVVLCPPVDEIVPTAKKLLPHLKPGVWITDVGSVKSPIVAGMTQLLGRRPVHFVGSHPIAGSHRTGVKASSVNLFRGATCVVTPAGKSSVRPILALWKAVGAKTRLMKPADHDAALALTSHFPHLLAHALVHLVASRRDRKMLTRLMAGSFRDVTRVASSDPEQWSQIFRANARQVRDTSALFRRELVRLERLLLRPALKARLARAQAFRKPLFARPA